MSAASRRRDPPTFRVIAGNEQLGRLKHDILVAGPEVPNPGAERRGLESRRLVDPQLGTLYREIGLDDFGSVEELATLVYDSGAQLGPAAFIFRRKRWTPRCSGSRWRRSPSSRARSTRSSQHRRADAASLGSDGGGSGLHAREIVVEDPGKPGAVVHPVPAGGVVFRPSTQLQLNSWTAASMP